jgi:S-DNA-T family DNA segregation ATPase FtsK/SpoIIIE
MASRTFAMRPAAQTNMDSQPVVVPEPETLDDASQSPQWQRLAPMLLMLVMVSFFALMIASGARSLASSPYAMMPMMTMGMMALMYLGVGGHGGGTPDDLDKKRKNYWLNLREKRKVAHHHGAQLHNLQSQVYPNPATLLSKVDTDSMWTVRPPVGGSGVDDSTALDEIPEALRPWLTARIGVGVARLVPGLKTKEQLAVDEQREPVTYASFRRFLRTQSFVTNCPTGISFADHLGYSFKGDPDAVLGLANAMITSLAFNHAPTHLGIGVITSLAPDDNTWDWLKWLPHTQNRFRADRSGTARLAWRSFADFAADPILSHPDNKAHLIVFVDTPDADAALPPSIDMDRAHNVTYVVLRALSETLSTEATQFKVSADGKFSTATQKNHVRADKLSALRARLIAQKMSELRPADWGTGVDTAVADVERATFYDALGITDLENWDPRPGWDKHEWDSHFDLPLGFEGLPDKRSNNVVVLDLGESSVGGAGPHGAIQGMTGAGKSFMLRSAVLAACAKYSATKLKFVLLDFKGGSTFQGFEKLPHVVANISNLTDQAETVDRAVEILEGEIERREAFLAAHKVDGIVNYRKKRAANPDKYPPLPELVIVVDEFREYMMTHKESGHLELLTRTGTVGRALAMHVVACSQYIDASLLRDLMEHLTFGVSLRTKDGSRSRTVLKTTDAAKDLPMGAGAALMHTDVDDVLTNFVGFDSTQLYIAPRQRQLLTAKAATSDAKGAPRLHSFTLGNDFSDTEVQAAENNSAAALPAGVELPTMAEALIDRIADFPLGGELLDLWKPSLRAPITYHDVKIEAATTQRLEIRIGDLDSPRESKRLPYVLRPEGGKSHIRVVGRGGSGRSTAVQAMVCGAASAYSPTFCSFYIIDYAGAKLSEIADMPNVGGYASKTDTDRVDRLIGEAFRLLDVREREFGSRAGVASLDQYFASRAAAPVEDDPFYHFFLVIDGFPSYLDDHPVAKETLLRLVTDGGRYGIHLVVTSESNARIPMKMQEYFATTIQLPIDDPGSAMGLTAKTRPMVKAIPDKQPGRCVDLDSGLAARIVVPQFEEITPIEFVKGMPKFEENGDFSAGIARFVAVMKQRHRTPGGEPITAPPVDPAPEVIDSSVVWEVYNRSRLARATHSLGHAPTSAEEFWQWWSTRTAMDKKLPIGVSTMDLRIVELPEQPSPHMLALGSPKSGRTSLLRGLINSVISQYTPDQAQFVIIESQYGLLTEQKELDKHGYLLAYAGDRPSVAGAIEKAAAMITPRAPKMEDGLTADVIRNRSWWTGPELFVIIDDILSVAPGGAMMAMSNPLEPLYALLEGRSDLGLHVYVTGPAQGFGGARMSNRAFKALEAAQAPVLLFSGPVAEGVIWPGSGIKFAARRPGQAMLVNPTVMSSEVIQTSHARPWEEGAGER